MSIVCRLIGHKYEVGAVDADGMCEVVCTRCLVKVRMPRSVLCGSGRHDWRAAAYTHYDMKKHNVIMRVATRRIWRCAHCGVVRQDEDHEMVDGIWFVVDGEFVHSTELGKHGYKMVVKGEKS